MARNRPCRCPESIWGMSTLVRVSSSSSLRWSGSAELYASAYASRAGSRNFMA